MKYLKQLGGLLFFLSFYGAFAQNANPSVGSTINFEGDPVNLFTGIPDISLPLYSMPTRSKDINIDFSLSYHPSGASLFYQRMGNCGSGWNLYAGGVISKTDNEGALLYTFNFMGNSGKFGVEFDYETGGFNKYKVLSANGSNFVVSATKDSEGRVIHFDVFDDRGYKFRFGKRDTTFKYSNDAWSSEDSAFQLTQIYDTNNNLLVTFGYALYHETVFKPYSTTISRNNELNILDNVVVEGYGCIKLDHNSLFIDKNRGLWIAYSKMTISSSLTIGNIDINNTIKTFEFYTSPYDDNEQVYRFTLDEVIEYGVNNDNLLKYKFFYKPFPVSFPTPFKGFSDEYGYYSFSDMYCDAYRYIDPEHITSGVLEKMILPTGGSVIYEFEGNNYSFDGNADQLDGVSGAEDDNFYMNFLETRNLHNYRKDILGSSFTLLNPARVYFKFNGNPYQTQIGSYYPSYGLYNALGQQLEVFEHQKPALNHWKNCNNLGLGSYKDLPAGEYTLSSFGAPGLYSMAYTLTPAEVPQRFWYGPGIRIKSIAYFDTDMRQDYFRTDLRFGIKPAKLIEYNYLLFGDPKSHSSGYLTINPETDQEVVRYRNVSVTEGRYNGRTDYTFVSPWDTNNTTELYDYKHGKLLNKKVYSANDPNNAQLEISYKYKVFNERNIGSQMFSKKVGWILPEEITTLEHYPNGTISKTDRFTYYDQTYKLKQKISTTSRSSQVITTNNYYKDFSSVSAHGKNLILPDYSESLIGSRLMSTSKVEYLNVWTDNQNTNISHLPSVVEQSKGTGSLEVMNKINRYDRYGHILETENSIGVKTCYIYGYNTTQLVAEISNMSYIDIPTQLITDIQTASDSGNEGNLLDKLNNLRNSPSLSNAQLTTYTYKPLIGISTMTDVRGYKISYEYDSNNRLTITKDEMGNIITEKSYYTKPQN